MDFNNYYSLDVASLSQGSLFTAASLESQNLAFPFEATTYEVDKSGEFFLDLKTNLPFVQRLPRSTYSMRTLL